QAERSPGGVCLCGVICLAPGTAGAAFVEVDLPSGGRTRVRSGDVVASRRGNGPCESVPVGSVGGRVGDVPEIALISRVRPAGGRPLAAALRRPDGRADALASKLQ